MVLVLAKEKMQINRMDVRPGVHGPLVLDTDTKTEKAFQWRKGRLPNKGAVTTGLFSADRQPGSILPSFRKV